MRVVVARMRILLVLAALLAVPAVAEARTFRGTVASVVDGDTVRIKAGSSTRAFDLAGVVAPRPAACFGRQAKARLTRLLPKRGAVKVVTVGRRGAQIVRRSTNVNRSMVRSGHARARTGGGRLGARLRRDEAAANARALGLHKACAPGLAAPLSTPPLITPPTPPPAETPAPAPPAGDDPAPTQPVDPCPENTSTDSYADPTVTPVAGKSPTGVSSPAECRFPTISGAVADLAARSITGGRVIATGASTVPAVFDDEQFPLSPPAGTIFTTTDESTGLDPTRYVVRSDGATAYALRLRGGAVRGLTFEGAGAPGATTMVLCDEGSATLTDVVLDGRGVVERGLDLWPGCDLVATRLRVKAFSGDGVLVLPLAGLSALASKIHDNGGDGLVIHGEVFMDVSIVAINGGNGITIDGSPGATFRNNDVRDNAGRGFEVWPSTVTFTANRVHNNSRSGTTTLLPQMQFHGPATYKVGPAGCDPVDVANVNRIYSYGTSDAAEFSVGVYASDGAIVDANNNAWRTATEAENVDQDAGSSIDASTMCGGIILYMDDATPAPVD